MTFNGVAVDLRIVEPEAYGNLLQHFTGSAEHNIDLRERAVRTGLSVSEHGIADTESGKVARYETEAEVYERLGLAYIEPELREGTARSRRPRGRAAGAGRARRHPRRPALPHDALGRAQHARRDGGGGAGARLRLPGDDRPLGQPRVRQPRHRRSACAERIEEVAAGTRARSGFRAARRLGGQHPPRRLARLRRGAARASSTGSSPASTPRSGSRATR